MEFGYLISLVGQQCIIKSRFSPLSTFISDTINTPNDTQMPLYDSIIHLPLLQLIFKIAVSLRIILKLTRHHFRSGISQVPSYLCPS